MSYKRLTRNQHFRSPGPKRILSLDGGGVRGIATLAYLKKLEDLLRERHGGRADFRLCHYFDLIAGTSTGSIIAAAMAQGGGGPRGVPPRRPSWHVVSSSAQAAGPRNRGQLVS